MHRNKSVNVHQFAMVPRADIPRSRFDRQSTHKTTFDAGLLIPIYCDEILPGDHYQVSATLFARMATPIFPIMDNLHLDTFWFFVPNRLVWDNWVKMMGERTNPDDSIDYTVPQMISPLGGYDVGSIFDYFGLPTVGQVDPAAQVSHSALPLRGYNLCWHEWFRDQNLQNAPYLTRGDGPDLPVNYALLRRGKRHDYFTSCLPWTQKGDPIPLPVGTTCPVTIQTNGQDIYLTDVDGTTETRMQTSNTGHVYGPQNATGFAYARFGPTGVGLEGIADLSAATGATINMLRTSFQMQKLLERDARSGTRYTESLLAHFGVSNDDLRLFRPQYLGGGSTPVSINPVAQTSGTGTYTDTPMGELAAFGTALGRNGFSATFKEHGHVFCLAAVRADLSYQQGLNRMWSRKTRFDHYYPVFANLGEQAVLNKEIYCKGTTDDELAFGYQERWAEYRYKPSMITALFRSTAAQPLDGWHLAQKFTALPTLNDSFIQDTPPMERVLAVGAEAAGQHFILDAFFDNKVTRAMPLYSVPGLIDHL